MHVLMMTQRVDEDHDVLGFTADWIEALAERVERLDVLTAYAGRYDLPSNVQVRSFGKERGYSKPRRVLEFERHCVRYAREVDVVFAHMIPNYVLASWPWFRTAGVPIVLWYAHANVSPNLRIAHQLVDRVLTPTAESFRLQSNKLEVVGHGIDTERFTPGPPDTIRSQLLGVGRVMPVKNFEVLIDAMAVLAERGRETTLRIAGNARGDLEYFKSVLHHAVDAGVRDRIEFLGSVPHNEIVREYRESGAFLNASETGSLDKTEIEAMACGTPTISSNDSYVAMVDDADIDRPLLTYPPGDSEALADRIEALLALNEGHYEVLCQECRHTVEEQHGVTALMESVSRVLANESEKYR